MKMLNLLYTEKKELSSFISENSIDNCPNILVQIYSGIVDRALLKEVTMVLKGLLPQAVVVGTTTDGELLDGKVLTNQVVISFLLLEKSYINAGILQYDDFPTLVEVGEAIMNEVATEKTKAILLFANGVHYDIESLIKGVNLHNSSIKVFGGLAGANGEFTDTHVWLNNQFTSSGVAAIGLDGEDLAIRSYSNNSWRKVGRQFQITRSNNNEIYEINGKKAVSILKQYLGELFVTELPSSGTQFPLLFERDGDTIRAFLTTVLPNGGVKIDRKVDLGEQFYFAYADGQSLLNASSKNINKIQQRHVECFLVFNCMARRRYFLPYVEKEMATIQQIAPTSGFFSYGEIDTPRKEQTEFTSYSTVVLACSESTEVNNYERIKLDFKIQNETKATIALTNLIDASANDIAQLNTDIEYSEQKYKSLFEHNSDIIFSTDISGRFTSVNPTFTKVFGYMEEEVLGKSALRFVEESDEKRVRRHFRRAIDGKEQFYEINLQSKNGKIQTFLIKNIPIIVNGENVGIFGIGRDVTAQKDAEKKVAYLAYFDAETSLPNRQNFNEKLAEYIKEIKIRKKKTKVAIMFIDLDRFKIINDSEGHFVGDELLKIVVERIHDELPSRSYLGRFGGDKFTLLLSKVSGVDEVLEVAQAIQSTIASPLFYNQKEFYLTASIGISMYPNDGDDEQTLLKNADAAMNQSKQLGGNKIKFYSTDMNEQSLFKIELESYLRKALEKQEFFLCYQPFIDLLTQQVVGAEALIRWDHPKLGLVSPLEFIPLAEETGLIIPIGEWVLITACIEAKKWQEQGYEKFSISVNVSASQFQQPNFVEIVKKALQISGLSPCALKLELTESVMLRNATYSITVMKEIQKLGVQLSVDDFGTGYSSLSYLKDLPINNLKIDRSFIKNLSMTSKDVAIVNAIITMGKGLNLNVVAEGLETEDQLDLLKSMQCDIGQGYYFSKPLIKEEFEKFIYNKLKNK
ncbi:bifunctional diguanylate cyclase/phosphodiesterase [Bacillus sp. FJAT-45066]|uniref:bifunctional diguanylate cyclase/phosphodiesterase n=1 Tax=Bacillus sp. FJAT-45066 TaxID=2011010 RepID=UPI000BB7DE0C|nr:EAL domain-containing protein [Bacillus sp. FJAT-45066]